MNKAIVIGSINMDIVAFVDKHPKVGETLFGKEVRYFPGGKGSNQAVACRRLGCETLMVGRIGNDAFGEQLLSFQKLEGIDIDNVHILNNTATGTAFITVAENGANTIIVIPGANALWTEDFLDEVDISQGDIVLAQFEVPDDVIAKTFAKAKRCGATTLLNPAPVRPVTPDLQTLTDLIVINEHELSALSASSVDVNADASIVSAIEHLSFQAYQAVIVTLGEHGVRIWQDDKLHRINARSVDAIDSTGAGDTFIGGLCAGLLSGQDMQQAAVFGNVAASISATRLGAASSIPTVDEVRKIARASN